MSDSKSSGGIGFFGVLGVAFICLKLCHVIDWSWWYVLSPLYAPISIVLVIALFVVVVRAWAGD